MRIACPLCGPRDRREFYYYGAEDFARRPEAGAPAEEWDAHLHLRDNPAGRHRDLWYHEAGCTAWLVIERDTVSHEIFSVEMLEHRKAAE